ncbi:MAG: HlyD family secretion protein, partial [bacterium]
VEVRLAQARLAQAHAALALARARQAKMVLRAPVSGLLVRKAVEAGDTVSQGKVLFEIAAAGQTEIVLQVDEKNLGRLAPGQVASVLADAYPGQPFQAAIFHIAPAVDAAKGSVEVKLRVPEPPAFLRADMTVSVEIVVGRREGALTLPVGALREVTSPKPWVLVAEGGRALRRDVQLGLRGTGVVEVRAGLKGGERVILPESGAEPGDRVRD